MKGNNKATVQKLYDEIIPIVKDIAANTADLLTIKEQLKEANIDLDTETISKIYSYITGVSTKSDEFENIWKDKIKINHFSYQLQKIM